MSIVCGHGFHAVSMLPALAVWYIDKKLMENKLLTNHFLNLAPALL